MPSQRAGFVLVLLATFAVPTGWLSAGEGEVPKKTSRVTKAPKDEDVPARRLPPYYNKVVDEAQREKIYRIQDKYADDLKKLQEQMDAIRLKRDKEVRDVLTPAQQRELDKLTNAKKDEVPAKGADKAEK